jgi:hypothetical protein
MVDFEKGIIQGVAWLCKLIVFLLPTKNATWARPRKRFLKDPAGPEK